VCWSNRPPLCERGQSAPLALAPRVLLVAHAHGV
jgi:hypothetical protein